MNLAARRVVPYHMVHVEHCKNCEKHQSSTRHIPGSYDKVFMELKNSLKHNIPPCLIYSNNTKIYPTMNRVGSFEITLRPYNSIQTRCIYSKIQNNKFPDHPTIVNELNQILGSEVYAFRNERSTFLEVSFVIYLY